MPKIVFVTQYHYLRYTGGAELQCWLLACEFQRRGWEVHYVSENNRPSAPVELDGIHLHNLPELLNARAGNRQQVSEIFADVKPDVVYNRVFNYYTWLSMSLAPAACVKIWAAAAKNDATVFGFLAGTFETKKFRQLLVLVPRMAYARYFARKGVKAATIRLAQHVEQQKNLSDAGIQTEVIRNSFLPVEDGQVQSHYGRPKILWVGSVKSWKQPEKFIELARRCVDLDAEFVIAGEVYEHVYQEMLNRAQAELPNFRYVGFVPLSHIEEYFSAAHVHVKTSLPFEGFPNTFVQAWLRGVPVLSLDVDPDRLLSDYGFGAVASNIEELEQKLRELIANPETRRQIGSRAREFAQKEFDLQANVDRLEELIRPLVKRILR